MTSQHPNTKPYRHQGKHLFGLKQSGSQQVLNDDYEYIYPEDPFLEETGPNARVWRTYLAESAIFDGNMVGEARDGLDSMLVFAGLFSAVVTSFLVQTSQSLQVNYSQVSAALLYEIAVQRAAPQSLNPNATFVPNTLDVWLNGLWVVSLSLSLVVALASVLIKQWLHRYMSLRSGTPGERSHVRHFRFAGFESWRVLTIIGSLPVIMHISLALFLAGLVLFLEPLHLVLSYIIGAITFVVYSLYLSSNILPIFYPQCPYQTPLSSFLLFLGEWLQSLALVIRHSANVDKGLKNSKSSFRSLDDLEKATIDHDYGTLSVQALHRLFTMSSNTSVHSVVMQAIGGLPADVKDTVNNLFDFERDCKPVLEHLLLSCTVEHQNNPLMRQPWDDVEDVAERICRSLLFFPVSLHGILASIVTRDEPIHKNCQATFLTTGSPMQLWHAVDYQEFISVHHDTPHHPFVWIAVMRNALSSSVLEVQDTHSPTSYSALCGALLRVLWGPLAMTSGSTMTTVVRSYPEHRPLVQNYLLQSISPFDCLDRRHLPLSNRVIEAILEFALHNIAWGRGHIDQWDLIDYIFQCFDDDLLKDGVFCEEEFTDFVGEFIVRLIEKSISVNNPLLPASQLAIQGIQERIIKMYWKTRPRHDYPLRQSEIIMIRRAVNPSQTDWSHHLERIKNNLSTDAMNRKVESMHLHYFCRQIGDFAFEILPSMLHSGSIDAHRFFVNEDFLHFLFEYRAHYPDYVTSTILVSSFIVGLKKTRDDIRESFVNYLYCPQNIRYALLLLISEQQLYKLDKPQEHEDVLGDLAQLCPGDELLTESRDWLTLLLTWARIAPSSSKDQKEGDVEFEVDTNLLQCLSSWDSLQKMAGMISVIELERMIQSLNHLLTKEIPLQEIIEQGPTTSTSESRKLAVIQDPPVATDQDASVDNAPLLTSRWTPFYRLLQWRDRSDAIDFSTSV